MDPLTNAINVLTSAIYKLSSGLNKSTEWVAIFVAISIGVIGLFQKKLEGYMFKPKLKASIELRPPDCHMAPLTQINTGRPMGNTYYLRFRVTNEGNQQLENVEVMINRVWKFLEEESKFIEIQHFLPINLRWSYYHTISMETIQPDAFKHCDFGHVLNTGNHPEWKLELESRGNPKTLLALDVTVAHNSAFHLLNPGKYKFEILFAASNTRASKKFVILNIANEWTEDEERMQKQLVNLDIQ